MKILSYIPVLLTCAMLLTSCSPLSRQAMKQVDRDSTFALVAENPSAFLDRRLLLDTVEAVLQRDSRRVLDAIRRVDQSGFAPRRYLQDLVELFRSLIICKLVESADELLDLVADEMLQVRKLAAEVSLEDLQHMVTLLLKSQGELAASPYPRLSVEMSLIRLANLPRSEELSRLISRFESLERRLGSTGSVALPPPSVRPEPPTGPDPGGAAPKKPEAPAAKHAGKLGWQGLVEHIKKNRPMLGSVLEHGRPLHYEPPQLVVGYQRGSFLLGQLQDADARKAIEDLAGHYSGRPISLQVVSLDDTPVEAPLSLAESRQAEETDRMRRLREDAMSHPALKAVQDVFGGQIKSVTPIDKGFV